MTDEELAVAILEMMGYERDETCPWEVWRNGGNYWEPPLNSPDGHIFAAEVKEFMRKKGYTWEETACYIEFSLPFVEPPWECVIGFDGMNEHPRAVCEAAVEALKGEACS